MSERICEGNSRILMQIKIYEEKLRYLKERERNGIEKRSERRLKEDLWGFLKIWGW